MGDTTKHGQRLVPSLAAMAVMLAATSASALEFGQISLSSHLNQPLAARIVLSSLSASERDSLKIRIASPDMFERFGIERSSEVDNLDVSSAQGSQSSDVVVEIRTSRAVREPFVDFLLEASTSHGSAVREYTVLLNPAGNSQGRPASVDGQPVVDQAAPATTPAAKPSSRRASSARAGSNARDPGRYGPVVAGETLFSIADRLRPSDITVPQMGVALFDANPQAFFGGMSGLRRGITLAVPGVASVRRISADAASQRTRADALADSQPAASPAQKPTQNKSVETTLAEAEAPPTERSTTPNVSTPAANPPAVNENTAAQAAFGQLSMPRNDAWSAVLTQPSLAVASALAEDVNTSANDAASTGGRASSPVDTSLVANDDEMPEPAADESTNLAASSPAAVAEQNAKPVMDVSESGDAGLWSPRNMLLGMLLLAALGIGAAVRRRRREEVPAEELDAQIHEIEAPPITAASPDSLSAVTGRPTDDEPVASEQTEQGPAVFADDPVSQDEWRDIDHQSLSAAPHTAASAVAETPHDTAAEDNVASSLDAGRFPASLTQITGDADDFDSIHASSATVAWSPDDNESVDGNSSEEPADPAATTDAYAVKDNEKTETGMTDRRDPDSIGALMRDGQGPTLDDDRDHGYDFSEQVLPEPGQRGHEHGVPADMSFDLDSYVAAADARTGSAGAAEDSDDSDDSGGASGATEPGALEMIDPTSLVGYGIDGEGSNDGNPLDSNTVEIRLDLARMYMEMEDEAMARDLLAEVVANGDDVQQREAQSLLESM